MRDIQGEILALLACGPVRRRTLLNGRKSAFKVVYQRMVDGHQIEEHAHTLMPGRMRPVYVCLPGQKPPVLKITRPRRADIRILMNAGMTREDAVQAILQCDFDQLLRLVGDAEVKGGLQVPRRRGRPEKIRNVPDSLFSAYLKPGL